MNDRTPLDSRAFRGALGSFATGVTIVTTRDGDGQDIGLTANSFNSVSLEPPMILWSLAKSSLSRPAFEGAGHFAVHVLAADQEALSNRFAKRGADKFTGLALERAENGVPLLDGCSARFLCRTAFRYEGGDHEIFVGEVIGFEHFDRPPLVFQGGRYAVSVQKPAEPRAAPRESDSSFSRNSLGYLLARAHYQLGTRLQPTLAERGISATEHSAISLLGVEDDRSTEELHELTAWTGQAVGQETIDALALRGLAARRQDGDVLRVTLTDAGRALAIELTAAAKSVEEDAIEPLEYSELLVLKSLLKRVIRRTDPGVPALWRETAPPG